MKIVIVGILGRLGQSIYNLCHNTSNTVVAGFDRVKTETADVKIYNNFLDIEESFDVIVDCSSQALVKDVLKFAVNKNKPLLIATTGLKESDYALINEASKKIAIIQSANLSIGMYIFKELVTKATTLLHQRYDIEIIEKHHNQKKDAPSGTALMLYDTVKEIKTDAEIIYDRHDITTKRLKNEVGISSIRGGGIVGDHDVLFINEDESITLSHQAFNKNIFASGAIISMKYLLKKENGLYTLEDVVNNK